MPIAALSAATRDDPLAHITAPPPDETDQQRQARLIAEAEAKRISDAIDEEIQQQERLAKKGQVVKILLLGQSESGKSTTLKNFQLMHSPKAFRAERASWRAVIQLNIVRSIRIILEALAEHQAQQNAPRPGTAQGPSSPASDIKLTPDHLKLKMRLAPLLQVEEALIKKLSPAGSGEVEATQLAQAPTSSGPIGRYKDKELAVNSSFAWKGVFNRLMNSTRDSFDSEVIDWDNPEDPGRVIDACSEDMIKLWSDPTIKRLLTAMSIRLEDMGGFFLDSIERVASPRYVPTDDDILRARLKTLGVTEYRFNIKEEQRLGLGSITREWRIFDVGGQRSLRCKRIIQKQDGAAWAPFFDDVNAILFLAAISAFDQALAEDPGVNRLEDSVLLWKSICSNPLLSQTNIVLFLNKIDILKAKLDSGVRFADHIVSYGNRPNDVESTSHYLRRKFAQIHKEHSSAGRSFYCHFTTVTDPKSTQHILVDLQDTVVRKNLAQSHLVG
ncbi:G-alpha-domain-containing protein [Cristinia sonorae]|uniref:G-alpha-domain-containing protein n=1 Tax=Cristinia sonorae TaxID=1940300 RepID=A0A8K0UL21_9AGAR|nr:G-alpha-domain-containing protein [Cristinia sonorae]